jgi:Domain of unknown function (DUF1942)
VKVKKLVGAVAATAMTLGVGAVTVAPAWAANNIKPYGLQETLNDAVTGAPMIGYTITGLSPSSDPVPHNGQLYAATVTVEGLGGWATPLVPLFNARAESGQNYRVIANAPGGPAVAPPGGSTTGKLYFDVVGDAPNSVVYNDGVQDLLVWVATNGVEIGAPEGPAGTSEIIGGTEIGGAEAGGDDVAPAVVPAPEEVSPFETPEQHNRGR